MGEVFDGRVSREEVDLVDLRLAGTIISNVSLGNGNVCFAIASAIGASSTA
jgi:hypothetical protein